MNETIQPYAEQQQKIKDFHKSYEPYLNSEKIINVERLQSIEGVEQIERFKKYADNFKNLERLTPEEILYLNLCDWLEPQATVINAEIKAMGGLKFIHPETGQQIIIQKLDLFHSLLGEMKPGSIRHTTKGGHLMIPELRAATLEMSEIKHVSNGYFEAFIKSGCNKKQCTYFPLETSVQDAVSIIKDSIQNPKKLSPKILNSSNAQGFQLTNYQLQNFVISIENKIGKFYPNPLD